MENFLRKFKEWLATTATGSMFKIALGAVAAYLLDNTAGLNLNPVVQGLVVILVPIVINWINDADGRYGFGSDEG